MKTNSTATAGNGRALWKLAPIALGLLLAACGGGGSDTTTAASDATDSTTTDGTATDGTGSGTAADSASDGDAANAPTPVPTGGFDTFAAPLFDRAKWQTLELVRDVGSAHLATRKYFGDASSDRAQLAFAQTGISKIAATVKVEDIALDDASTADARARARILGTWWHIFFLPVDGSSGDVFAQLSIEQAVGGDPRIVYLVGDCGDAACSTVRVSQSGDLGPATIGQEYRLSIEAAPNQTFNFGVDGVITPVVTGLPPGPFPSAEFKILRSDVRGLDAEGEGAYVRASFDAIEVNDAPYDDFSSGQFDPAKWVDSGAEPAELFTRRIEDGVLRTRLSAPGGTTQSNSLLPVLQGNPASAAADVTVNASSRIGGSSPRARVGGFWYHSGEASSGNNGDVYADVSLTDNGAGIVARAIAVLCSDDACANFTSLFDDTTSLGSVTLGENRRLEIAWDGNQFTYKAGDASVSFAPGATAPVSGPAQQPRILIGTRIAGDGAGSDGFIDASFDNIDLSTD